MGEWHVLNMFVLQAVKLRFRSHVKHFWMFIKQGGYGWGASIIVRRVWVRVTQGSVCCVLYPGLNTCRELLGLSIKYNISTIVFGNQYQPRPSVRWQSIHKIAAACVFDKITKLSCDWESHGALQLVHTTGYVLSDVCTHRTIASIVSWTNVQMALMKFWKPLYWDMFSPPKWQLLEIVMQPSIPSTVS